MPQKLIWTPAADARIRDLRAAGATWDDIAAAIGISRYTVIDRGRRIGAQQARARPAPAECAADEASELAAYLADPQREPLPVGHPTSWAVITDRTWLTGTRYPWPSARELAVTPPCPSDNIDSDIDTIRNIS